MFCMNCGQQLPDGAKFCMKCGTPQGAVSPTGTPQVGTINLDGTHTFVPAMCPNCNAQMKVDSTYKIAVCESCGTECLVQDAIKTLTIKGNIQVGNATINVSGTNTDSLLQRVEIMLKDGDFDGAMSKCDTILDSDPTNGKVYYYMLMSDLRCRSKNELAILTKPFDRNQYYIKAIQYGEPELKNELQGYINKIYAKCDANLKNPTVGAEVRFGHYSKGQSIIWKILKIQNNTLFIISSENICSQYYNDRRDNKNVWVFCTLRKWLNNDFLNGCFTPAEQAKILPSKLNNDKNPRYNTHGGVPTTDKVFLLSIDEAKELFADNLARSNGSEWWLRSPGEKQSDTAYVYYTGDITESGTTPYKKFGVRPALWLNLNS